jgi:hypothetical protein
MKDYFEKLKLLGIYTSRIHWVGVTDFCFQVRRERRVAEVEKSLLEPELLKL